MFLNWCSEPIYFDLSVLIIPFFEKGDDVGGVKEAEKTTEEALEKHPSQECLSDDVGIDVGEDVGEDVGDDNGD